MSIPDYEIIATLGPSSTSRDILESTASAGANQFRLNTSHLTLSQFNRWLEKLNPFLDSLGLKLVLDLQGSNWRLGNFAPIELKDGQKVNFILGKKTTRPDVIPVPHQDFSCCENVGFKSIYEK